MRRRFVQINGELVEYGQHAAEPVAPLVMPDIKPYTSMIDGREITSRSVHRDHLRQHGCVEIGNEALKGAPQGIPDVLPQKRKELIQAQIDAMSHEEFKAAIKKDADRVKWETNY